MKISYVNSYTNTYKNLNSVKKENSKITQPSFKRSYWDDDENENNNSYSLFDRLRDYTLFNTGAHEFQKKQIYGIKAEELSEEEKQMLSFDYDKLKSLYVNNLTVSTDRKGVRGSCLLGANSVLLPKIKACGIEKIIDLRDERNFNEPYNACKENGLEYLCMPMKTDKMICDGYTKYLPAIFKAMDEGKYYIGCEEGLNRTDTMIALHYLLDPDVNVVPVLKSEDPLTIIKIARDNIKKYIKEYKQEHKSEEIEPIVESLGWKDVQHFKSEYRQRLVRLSHLNVNNN